MYALSFRTNLSLSVLFWFGFQAKVTVTAEEDVWDEAQHT